jgi:TolB protein
MRPTASHRTAWLLAVALLATRLMAGERTELTIPGVSDPTTLIPVTLDGFRGESATAIQFDLEVAGFKVVPPEQAMLQISGSADANLVGTVRDRNRTVLLNKQYTGGSTRSQAHAFTDDVVSLIPGRIGIARTKIALRLESGGNSEIFLADYDGFNALPLTQDRTINRDPAWVPGRRILYYTSYRSGNPFLYSHDLQSGVRRLVAGYPGVNASAAVSPDGRRIAMILSRAGSPDVYVADADGGGLRRLTTTKEDESSPCWSPDGRSLCFASRMEGRSQLYLASPDGGPMRRLPVTNLGGGKSEPDWSPDGKTIVFTSMIGGFQICTVPAGGGEASVLCSGEDPAWASNSRTVLFTRRVGGQRVLSLLDVPTKGVKDVRRFSGSSSQPAWAR